MAASGRVDLHVGLARVLASLPEAERRTLGRAAGLGAPAAAPDALAAGVCRPSALAAVLDGLGDDGVEILCALTWRWRGQVPTDRLGRVAARYDWSPERLGEAVRRVRSYGLAIPFAPYDMLVVPAEVRTALGPAVLRRFARPAPEGASPLTRPPRAILADAGRLLGRLRVGARATASGSLTKRAQAELRRLVALDHHQTIAALPPLSWAEYDRALVLPLLLLAGLSLLGRGVEEKLVVSLPSAARWLRLDAWSQWRVFAEAWLELLEPRDPLAALSTPRCLAALAPDAWVALGDLADLDLPLLTERRPFNVDALRYFTAKGLELGALDVLCGPDDETLPWIRPSAALRAWMARDSAPSAFTTSLEESGLAVTGAGEVVVPAALAAVDWADLCAFCSLVSLDRAAILRPTRDSVAAAVGADLPVEGFLARLERLSGGPVPQAVDFQVRDWGVSRSVDVRLAVLVQAADEASAREVAAAQGLRPGDLEALAPGLWRAPAHRLAAVREVLERGGLRVHGDRLTGRLPIESADARAHRLWPGYAAGTGRLSVEAAVGRFVADA